MPRTSVVTGAASGIGEATCELLREHGQQVIGIDLHDADVTVDLATAAGRAALLGEVTALSGGSIDAVLAVAGSAAPVAVTAEPGRSAGSISCQAVISAPIEDSVRPSRRGRCAWRRLLRLGGSWLGLD